MRRVVIAQQVFPRVEFEQDGDAAVLIIQKLPVIAQRDFIKVAIMRATPPRARPSP